jgi:hypothetical protein
MFFAGVTSCLLALRLYAVDFRAKPPLTRHVTVNDARGLIAGSKCAMVVMARGSHHRRRCGGKQTSLLAPVRQQARMSLPEILPGKF